MAKRNLKTAVLAIDPGGTTGVAAGYVDLQPTRRETLATLSNAKSVEVEGNYLEQAVKLDNIFKNFVYTANVEQSIPLQNIHIAIEDFVLRRRKEGGATGNLTSCWVAAAMTGMWSKIVIRMDDGKQITEYATKSENIHWQQPSEAKTLMTNERLKQYGLWVIGSEHERDAWRHFGLRVDKCMTERGV